MGWVLAARMSVTLLLIALAVPTPARAAGEGGASEIEVAAALGVTGDESTFGQGSLEGIELAVEEANAARTGPRIKLVTYDDRSSDDEARTNAQKIVASQAVLVLGPDL